MDETKSCPPKKRAAATKATRTVATWFCRGISVPGFSGPRGMFRFKMTHYLVAEEVDCVFRHVLKATFRVPDAPIVRSLLYS